MPSESPAWRDVMRANFREARCSGSPSLVHWCTNLAWYWRAEPPGTLDPRSAAQILAVLRTQVKENAGAGILITHSRTAAETADRILVLDADGLKVPEPAT